MNKLKFKTFTWPNNPERLHVEYVREPVYEKNDAGDTMFVGMGPLRRTVTGSGAFFGSGAYDSFRELAALMGQSTPGSLIHPVCGTMNAYFTELKLSQEPRENFAAYTFAFREADSSGAIPK